MHFPPHESAILTVYKCKRQVIVEYRIEGIISGLSVKNQKCLILSMIIDDLHIER